MMEFNKKFEQLSGLTGNEFVYGVVFYIAVAVAIMIAVQLIFGLGTVTEAPYGVSPMIGHMDNAITTFFGV
jgi:hypothetical protein